MTDCTLNRSLTMPDSPNTELAYRVLDAARAHPNHFDMRVWVDSDTEEPVGIDQLTAPTCGTTACFAGWTVAMRGYQLDDGSYAIDRYGNLEGHVSDVAAELLGVSSDEAEALFYSHPYLLDDTVSEIFGPRPNVQDETR